MKRCYLIGEHLGHSCSPEIHRAFGRYDYELKELAPAELEPFLRGRDFDGLNVTMPYKEAVIPLLDRLDPAAAAIGAVNTVGNRGGVPWGYNTDFGGMAAALARAGVEVRGKHAFVLGTGGTSRTALAVCRALGAAEISRVSRTGREAALTYEQAAALFRAPPHPAAARASSPQGKGLGAVLINCTPVGMWPEPEGLPLDLKTLQLCHSERSEESVPPVPAVFDCVYNPLRTRLVLEARALGVPAAGGLYMLVMQAALACECFTGTPVEDEQVDIIYDSLRWDRENLVLIGMPGAGKSTVGRILAQKTGKTFVDSDEEITKRARKSIPAMFAEDGEAAFRTLETEIIRQAALQLGCVIATGGGTILREENLRRLRQNGRLILLDRPLSALEPSPERPLGDTAEKLAALYEARAPLYAAAADLRVPNRGSPEEAAALILTML